MCRDCACTKHRPHPRRRHGLFGPRLLRRRDQDAEPRLAGRGRAAVHAVLQHGPLLPDAGQPAHGSLSAPGGHRAHDGRQGPRRLSRRPEPQLPDDRRSAQAGRLRDVRRRQVARHAAREAGRPQGQLAAAARLRSLLRHDHRRGQLLRSGHAGPRQHDDLALRRSGVPARSTYYYTDAISDHAVRFIAEHGQNTPDKPFFLYVAYTAAHWPMHALEEDIAKYKASTTPATTRSARHASSE